MVHFLVRLRMALCTGAYDGPCELRGSACWRLVELLELLLAWIVVSVGALMELFACPITNLW